MIRTVGIVSLSSGILGEPFVQHEVRLGLARLQDYGLQVRFLPHARAGLEALGCPHLQVRAYSKLFGLAELAELAELCRSSSIQTLEAILQYDPGLGDADYVAVVGAHQIMLEYLGAAFDVGCLKQAALQQNTIQGRQCGIGIHSQIGGVA